jgi:hypothetical protein
MTFAIDGKQYIAFMGGSGGTASPGQNNDPATPPKQKPQLMVFGLDGKAPVGKAGGAVPAAADPHQQ